MEQRFSDNESSRRDIPSFIEPRPPLINNPFMRPRPEKGRNLMELFEEDSEIEEPELVQVYLRMKPYASPNNLYEVRSDNCLVTSLDTTTAGHGRRTQHNVSRMYKFSQIFNAQCSQKEIFERVVKENLKKLPDGHSYTLLAYGASGSGKTYTLMGTVNSPGLIPRSLEYVFKLVNASQQPMYKPTGGESEKLEYNQQEFELQWVKKLRQVSAPQRDKYKRMSAQLKNDLAISTFDLTNKTKYYVWVSFVEIYNEAIYDLLAPPDKRTKLRIREDTTGQVYVKGVTQAFVRSGVEAYDVMVAGKHNLVVAATGVHAQSSRSHCIFTITMLTETDGEIRTSCIRLCDLAGCERARATRNTGTRMLESRAINSSLHVLERCLHMLRRNQNQRHEAMVPYRESKLTRLLGSGLSGSRGEVVSMVVTLNPAPQYAQETKHVLSLAAVAQDIQINNTAMFASTYESSTQDTTVLNSTAEVMKLRADNELLHFELVQAQVRNNELLAAMDEKLEHSANTMREMVEEAKDMTQQYYESQMNALRAEMEDMIEEYEARLSETAPPAVSSGTPTRFLQTKVANLLTDIAILEDKLSAERLARARAEEEVKHLRNCIDERDDSSNGEEIENEVNKQEDTLSQSVKARGSCFVQESAVDTSSDDSIVFAVNTKETETSSNQPESARVTYFVRNSDIDTSSGDGVEFAVNTKETETSSNENARETYFVSNSAMETSSNDGIEHAVNTKATETSSNQPESARVTYFVRNSDTSSNDGVEFAVNTKETETSSNENARETYFVSNSAMETSSDDGIEHAVNTKEAETSTNEPENSRATYFVRSSAINTSIDEEMQEVGENKTVLKEAIVEKASDIFKHPKKLSETLVSRIIKSLKKSTHSNNSDSSLRQFEQMEKASQECGNDSSEQNSVFDDIKFLKEKRTYFGENAESIADKLHLTAKKDASETFISSNKTKDSIADENYEKNEKIKSNAVPLCHNMEENIDFVKNVLISKQGNEYRTYFNNIEVSSEHITNKIVADIKTSCRKNHERSPSIVSDDMEPFKPSTMKKLLGENIAKLEVLSSIHHKASGKKYNSIDMFEGLESPLVKTKKEVIATTKITNLDNLDEARISIEKLDLEQKIREDIKQEIQFESISSDNEDKKLQIHEPVTIKKAHTMKENVNIVVTTEQNETQINDSTIQEFEKIYNNISTRRPTEFDLLTMTTQEIDANEKDDGKTVDKELTNTDKENAQKKLTETTALQNKEVKYDLRNKGKSLSKSVLNVCDEGNINEDDEYLLKNMGKNVSKSKCKKQSLRLRRRKMQGENNSDQETEKLKDILNLKKEFSDVTLGLPAFKKEVKDIPSPEKLPDGNLPGDENLPPLMGIQSCPSKSVTRSRRKLFTPRAEPLEESPSEAGNSTERLYVPRPSYHRARARRKL